MFKNYIFKFLNFIKSNIIKLITRKITSNPIIAIIGSIILGPYSFRAIGYINNKWLAKEDAIPIKIDSFHLRLKKYFAMNIAVKYIANSEIM